MNSGLGNLGVGMKIPSDRVKEFAVDYSLNGFVLYYEDDYEDIDHKVTSSAVFANTNEGRQELINCIIDNLGWLPNKHGNGVLCEIVKVMEDI